MKKSAVKSMQRNTPTRSRWLAMLGSPVAVPHGVRMAELASYCAKARELQARLPKRYRERLVKRRIAPRLVALLWDSLADLDAIGFENFAAIIRRIREHNETADQGSNRHALPTVEKLFRVADVARTKGKPLTRSEVLQRAGVDKEHDDASRERKALTLAGRWLAPDKRGRKKGTRNR